MITLMWIALGALGAFILVAAIFGVRAVWREHSGDPGLTVHAVEGFADLGPMPPEIAHDAWETPPARIQVTEVGIPDSLAYRYGKVGDMGPAPYEQHIPQTPAAAVEQVSPTPLPPPPVPLHETHQAATAVGAAIAATAARIAEKERAKKEAWAAEVAATSPWEDQPPFGDWERGDSITMPAIKAGA